LRPNEVRALPHDLRPSILDDFGPVVAIRSYAGEWRYTFNVPAKVEAESFRAGRLQGDADIALFGIVQEALMNVGKYGRAQSVDVSLSTTDEGVLLEIRDDGLGLDLNELQAPTRRGCLGLYGMRERALLLGGRVTIDTAHGHGTGITLTAPIPWPCPSARFRIGNPLKRICNKRVTA
jgi:signal transduction histidine kinase